MTKAPMNERLQRLAAAALLVREQYDAQQKAMTDEKEAALDLIRTVLTCFRSKRARAEIAKTIADEFGDKP